MQRPDGSPPSAVDLHSIPGWPDDVSRVLRGSRSAPFGKVGNTQFDSADPLAIASIADPGTGKCVGSNGAGVATAVTLPTVPRFVTGIIPAAGTTPTAGTGFTYTHGATGTYVFSFTVAFTATPIVVVSLEGNLTTGIRVSTAPTTTGFTVGCYNSSTFAAVDSAFDFIAMDVQ